MQREKSQEVEVTIMFNCMGIVTDIAIFAMDLCDTFIIIG